jgi:hypothetical protein
MWLKFFFLRLYRKTLALVARKFSGYFFGADTHNLKGYTLSSSQMRHSDFERGSYSDLR